MKKQLAIVAVFAAFAGIAGNAEAQQARHAAAKSQAKPQLCEEVTAVASGFGKEKITGFANSNLDLAIDSAKNRLADKGAKGFKVAKRNVACQYYIDFGGPIGREHKCTASAQLCGKG
jgi:hypothetical protein